MNLGIFGYLLNIIKHNIVHNSYMNNNFKIFIYFMKQCPLHMPSGHNF